MFPILYHAHHGLHNEDLRFWLDLAGHSPGPILELGCGTGRVLLPLLRAGHQVVGLDRDWEMLAALRAGLPAGKSLTAQLFQADFTAFRLERKFGLILLACNTYSTLDREQRLLLLNLIRDHLLSRGVFAVSLPNPLGLKRLPSHAEPEIEEIFTHPVDGEPVQVSSAWERDAQTLQLIWHYDHLLPEGSVQRISVKTTHYLISSEEYQSEMRAVGLTVQKMLGDFDGSAFTAASPQLIFLISLQGIGALGPRRS